MIGRIRHSVSRTLRTWFPDREIEYEAIILALVIGLVVVLTVLPAPPNSLTVSPYTTADWAAMVEEYGIAPRANGKVRETIPRIYLKQFPNDWPADLLVDERKRLFVAALLPLVLAENERLSAERAKLIPILKRMEGGKTPSRAERKFVEALAAEYGLDEVNAGLLRRRVVPIPVSLALAQGAIESGWGTSRFAMEGQALFGQWVWDDDAGLVPDARAEGASHAVRSFTDLAESVRSYARNLNTHGAYRNFRGRRASLMESRGGDGTAVSGTQLAATLVRYSERREEYVAELRTVIRVNGFGDYRRVRLRDTINIPSPDSGDPSI